MISHRKGNKRNNSLLGTIFLMIAWNMGDMTVRISGAHINLGFFQLIDDGFLLLFGPLFFFYVQMVIYKDYQFRAKSWIHFLPYLAFTTQSLLPGILAHTAFDIVNFSYWWSDLAGTFERKPIGMTGMDGHFIVATLIVGGATLLFVISIRKLLKRN